MKPLLPTLKEKKRYLLIKKEGIKNQNPNTNKIIIKKIKEKLGLIDSAIAGIKLIEGDEKTLIIRTSLKNLLRVRAIITLITTIKEKNQEEKIRLRVIKTSGTIKKIRKAKEELLKKEEKTKK